MTLCIQAGFPKSGNFLLHTILREILAGAGKFSSYRSMCDLPPDIQQYVTTYKGIEADCIKVINGQLHLVIPHPELQPLAIEDLASFFRQAALLWTHQKFSACYESLFSSVPVWFYIYRDGRDAITSLFHYVVSPIMLKRFPDYRVTDVVRLFQDLDYFAKHVNNWQEHIHSWTAADIRRIQWIRFEDLVADRRKICTLIGDVLKLPVDLDRLEKQTQFNRMARLSPEHVRSGTSGGWKSCFTAVHKKIFKDIAGQTLVGLGYEADLDW